MATGLFASNTFADITTAEAYINIGSVSSSNYSLEWKATTANTGQPRIYVTANIYFNDIKKDSNSKYGAAKVTISNTLSASKNVRGLWEINSTHKEYDGTGRTTDIASDYDKVQWDPASLSGSDVTEMEKMLVDFEREITEEISNSFKINVEGYDYFKAVKVGEVGNSESLEEIVTDVMTNQTEGDVIPMVYVHENNKKAYIFEKKADGRNVVYKLSKKADGEWTVADMTEKDGERFQAE